MSDLVISELLASRLCHDLVGPISAISNGMELLEEDLGMDDEAKGLVAGSAQQASTLLRFFRIAYGVGGSVGAELQQIKDLAAGFCSYRKVTVNWHSDGVAMLPDNLGKLLLNLIVVASEALPRGGGIEMTLGQETSGYSVSVAAVGSEVGLRDETLSGLASGISVAALTPRSVHAFFLYQLVERMNGCFSLHTDEPGCLNISVLLA